MSLPDAIWNCLTKHLLPIASCPDTGLFNPYNSSDPGLDRRNAARIRRENLHRYVDCFVRQPRFLLVGEAPGWRGCRLSGVPFTSEAQLVQRTVPFAGRQSSHAAEPFTENSANYVWEVLGDLHPNVFLWNTVPLHPHAPGSPTGNRKPNAGERRQFAALTEELIRILNPQVVVAVGRVAEQALAKHGPKYLRHPSFGGSTAFQNGVASLRKARTPCPPASEQP